MAVANKKKKIFDGRYEVLSIVGRGACSVVYHARHASSASGEVALKVLLNEKMQGSHGERLRKEALAMVSSRHRYVVRLDDFHSVGDLCYLSMEFAPEGDLRKFAAKNQGKLTIAQAELFLNQSAEALEFVHKVGIVHRDIKPDNILVVNDQETRLADFGVAVLPGEKSSLADLRNGIGTMSYMAPEVLEGTGYDKLSDIYALGVTFYELLSGTHPFEKVPLMKQLEAREDKNVKPLSAIVPNIPGYLSNVIMQAMSYSPSMRFASLKELLDALRAGNKQPGAAKAAAQPTVQRATAQQAAAQQAPAAHAAPQAPSAQPAAGAPPRHKMTPLQKPGAPRDIAPKEAAPKEPAAPHQAAKEPLSKDAPPRREREQRPPRREQRQEARPAEGIQNKPQREAPRAPAAAAQPAQQAAPKSQPGPIPGIREKSPIPPKSLERPQAAEPQQPKAQPAPQKESAPPKDTVAATMALTSDEVADLLGTGKPKQSGGLRANAAETMQMPIEDVQQVIAAATATSEKIKQDIPADYSTADDELDQPPLVREQPFRQPLLRDKGPNKPLREKEKQRASSYMPPPQPPAAARRPSFLSRLALLVIIGLGGAYVAQNYFNVNLSSAVNAAMTSAINLVHDNNQPAGPSPIPHYSKQPLTFPNLPSGMYTGTISGIISDAPIPLTLISFADQGKIAVIVGHAGWTPRVITIENPSEEDGAEQAERPLRFSSNGFVIDLNGKSEGETLSGTFKNAITGDHGEWQVTPQM